MPAVYVYNPGTNRVEKYYKGLLEAMPYVTNRTMTVGEFKANSISTILWTDKRMLEAWNTFRTGWGRPIFIGYAFKRIWEGGHAGQSQHYAGTALDLGHTLTVADRNTLYGYAVNSGVWSYVELESRWVHVDKRFGTPACASGGYPQLSVGSKGVYVFVMQDALYALGFNYCGLDGIFGAKSQRAVMDFQINQGLSVTGVVDCNTWLRLTSLTNGIGATSTVII